MLSSHVPLDEEGEPDITTRRAAKLLLLVLLLVDAGLSPPRKAEAGAGPRKAREERSRRRSVRRALLVMLRLLLRKDAAADGSRLVGDVAMVLAVLWVGLCVRKGVRWCTRSGKRGGRIDYRNAYVTRFQDWSKPATMQHEALITPVHPTHTTQRHRQEKLSKHCPAGRAS